MIFGNNDAMIIRYEWNDSFSGELLIKAKNF